MKLWALVLSLVLATVRARAPQIGSVLVRDQFVTLEELKSGRKIDTCASPLQSLVSLEETASAPIQQSRLKNGMTVLIQPLRNHPVVSVQVWHRVGSHNEDISVNGVSHLLEHLLFKGTRDRPIQFMRLFYALGADSNAFTNLDVTVYYETAESDKLEHLLTLEVDRMTNALIDSEHVTSERDVVISELMGYEGRASYRLNRALLLKIFGNKTGYGLPVGGFVEDVESLTLEQVQEHYQKHYGPDQATLVIVGDVDPTVALKKVLDLWKTEVVSGASVPKPAPAPASPINPVMSHIIMWYLLTTGYWFPANPLFNLFATQYLFMLWNSIAVTPKPVPAPVPVPVPAPAFLAPKSVGVPHNSQFDSVIKSLGFENLDDSQTTALYDLFSRLHTSDVQQGGLSQPTMNLIQLEEERNPTSAALLSEFVAEFNRLNAVEVLKPRRHTNLAPSPFFNPFSSNRHAPPIKTAEPPKFVIDKSDILVMEDDTSKNSNFIETVFVLDSLKFSSLDRAALHVLDEILSGGHMALIHSYLSHHDISWNSVSTDYSANLDSMWYTISVSVSDPSHLKLVIPALEHLVNDLQVAKVATEDLERAKVNIKVVMLQGTSAEDVANNLGESYVLGNDAKFQDRYAVALQKVTKSDIQEFVKAHFDGSRTQSAIFRSAEKKQLDKEKEAPKVSIHSHTKRIPTNVFGVSQKTDLTSVLLEGDFDDFLQRNPVTFAPVAPRKRIETVELIQTKPESTGFVDPLETLKYLPQLPPITVPKIELGKRFVLSNGLEMILLPTDPSDELIRVSGRVMVGSAHDPPGLSGLAMITGSMLMYGSQNYSYADYIMNLENDGSEFSVKPGRESTAFAGLALRDNFPRLLEIAKHVLLYPTFEKDIFHAFQVALSELVVPGQKSQEEIARQELQSMVFPDDHPFRRFATQTSYSTITHEDVLKFFSSNYGPSATRLIITGGFSMEEVRSLVQEVFGEWTAPSVSPSAVMVNKGSPGETQPKTVTKPYVGAADAITLLGRRGRSRCDPEHWVSMVASQILGGDTLSARLGTHVRDELGLTYGVYSVVESGVADGMIVVRMQTAPDKTAAATEAVYKVLQDFETNGVTEAEVELAKRHLHSQQTLALDQRENVGTLMLNRYLCDAQAGDDMITKTYERIAGVTHEQVNAFIKSNLQASSFHRVVVGELDPNAGSS
eukprot:c52221_g1_i1.p1 GENE.c52221_g1_i1~~c52221_g1_i1.p1  ORF type:complete len:1195 (+),score=240.48 c52221_g1_i1:24-3587(+)